ncbi:lysophospholipid acyltransferase family protein [Sphingobium aromaticiconvertens]|uniref:lysophospholipid acyltransferase family protein n=1 Tax=Sphingobium aromaticiconvertens TaxID=365341 RepID=UPI0030170F31
MVAQLRRFRRIAALIGALALCLPLHLIWRLLRLRSPWPPRFLGLAARAVGARVSITGSPLAADVFFIANHVSWIDILAMGGTTGTAFIAKDDIAAWPMVGWLAALNNTVFITRERRGSLNDQLLIIREAMAGHQPLALFPEGTTGDGRTLLPFKPSLLAVMLPPPRAVLVQPVHIDYGAAATDIAWTGEESAGANASRLFARAGSLPVTLHFLEPFDPAALPDRKALTAQAQKRIAASLAAHAVPSAVADGPV